MWQEPRTQNQQKGLCASVSLWRIKGGKLNSLGTHRFNQRQSQ